MFFDNLQVIVTKGPLLEETHYYPFGLTMAGISSKALNFGAPENKYKFNGIEQNNDFDLNIYDAQYRNLDPQIGRFWQIDQRPTESISLYSSMFNNPVLINDPLGDTGRIGTLTDNVIKANGKEYKKTDLVNGLVNQWSKISGLKLSLNENGDLVNEGVASNKGISKTARDEILNLIKSDGTVYIDFSTISSQGIQVSDPCVSAIMINPADIDKFVSGTSQDLNKMTFGLGMTALHELGHTFLHDNFSHSLATLNSFGVIDETDVRTNKIRSELGASWGQRTSYTSLQVGNNEYLPMSKASLHTLNEAIIKMGQINSSNPMVRSVEMSKIQVPTSGIIKF